MASSPVSSEIGTLTVVDDREFTINKQMCHVRSSVGNHNDILESTTPIERTSEVYDDDSESAANLLNKLDQALNHLNSDASNAHENIAQLETSKDIFSNPGRMNEDETFDSYMNRVHSEKATKNDCKNTEPMILDDVKCKGVKSDKIQSTSETSNDNHLANAELDQVEIVTVSSNPNSCIENSEIQKNSDEQMNSSFSEIMCVDQNDRTLSNGTRIKIMSISPVYEGNLKNSGKLTKPSLSTDSNAIVNDTTEIALTDTKVQLNDGVLPETVDNSTKLSPIRSSSYDMSHQLQPSILESVLSTPPSLTITDDQSTINVSASNAISKPSGLSHSLSETSTEYVPLDSVSYQQSSAFAKPPPLKRAPTANSENNSKKLRPTAQFLYDIGLSLVKQVVYKELIKLQECKEKIGVLSSQSAKQLERLRKQSNDTDEKTEHLRCDLDKRCSMCTFSTESIHVLYWHKEYPHTNSREALLCSHCSFISKSRVSFTYHMASKHGMQGRLHPRNLSFTCTTCMYQNNGRAAYEKHVIRCAANFNINYNLLPSTALHCNFCLSGGIFIFDSVKSNNMPILLMAPNAGGQNHMPRLKLIPQKSLIKPQDQTLELAKTPQAQPKIHKRPITLIGNKPVVFHLQHPVPDTPSIAVRAPIPFKPHAVSTAPVLQSQVKSSTAARQPSPLTNVISGVKGGNFTVRQMIAKSKLESNSISLLPSVDPNKNKNAMYPPVRLTNSSMTSVTMANRSDSVNQITNRLDLRSMVKNLANKHVSKTEQKSPGVVSLTPVTTANPANQNIISYSDSKTKSKNIRDYAQKNNLIACEICGGFVKDVSALRIHFHFAHKVNLPESSNSESPSPSVKCKRCPQTFWTERGLKQHMLQAKHESDYTQGVAFSYVCCVCKRRVQYLLNHFSAIHNLTLLDFMNAIRCCICNESFPRMAILIEHLEKTHELYVAMTGGTVKIISTGGGIIAPTDYSQYIMAPQAKCLQCSATFASKTLLARHCIKAHNMCSICNSTFANISELESHICSSYKNNSLRTCEVCEVELSTKNYVKHVEHAHLKTCRVNLKRLPSDTLMNDVACDVKHPKLDATCSQSDLTSSVTVDNCSETFNSI